MQGKRETRNSSSACQHRGRVELLSCYCHIREIGGTGVVLRSKRGMRANIRGKLGLHRRSKRRNVLGEQRRNCEGQGVS